MIALDTEATGLDLYHGARPFLVTICDEQGNNIWWEWEVNPLTRKPRVPVEDLKEIQACLDENEYLVLQNAKYDYTGLRLLFQDAGLKLCWDWGKVYDTLLAGHLLASNQPHDLTTMTLVYLGVNISPLEDALETVTKETLKLVKVRYPTWRVAKAGLFDMPSAKEKTWQYDSWVPRQLAIEEGLGENHPWYTACSRYANGDSSATIALFQKQREILEERKLWKIYQERRKILYAVGAMEWAGVTLNQDRAKELEQLYSTAAASYHRVCIHLADGELETLPKNGASNALKSVLFDKFKLVSSRTTARGNASVDKYVLDDWLATLPRQSRAYAFIRALKDYRKRQTQLSYITGYKRFWLLLDQDNPGLDPWHILHPSVNPTGTDTLRMASSNPNEQNISKQEIAELGREHGRNMRYLFGPAPGREWWSLDAENIELRIPAYEAGETAMIELFERPGDPPYYGSNHLLFFDILHPDLFAKHGKGVKKVYADTWYQWTKNGDFAVQYGAVAASGTADRAYHVLGAQEKIESHLVKIKQLGQQWIRFAEKHGYVETMPDKTVDSERGYPLLCTRSKWGHILPTVPLSYHVQGTAMWWMCKAMVRCQGYLDELNSRRKPEYHAHLVMQIHDEVVFDFPKSKVDPASVKDWKTDKSGYLHTNLPYLRKIQKLMEQGGKDIGVPTPVSVEYHPVTWNEGVSN